LTTGNLSSLKNSLRPAILRKWRRSRRVIDQRQQKQKEQRGQKGQKEFFALFALFALFASRLFSSKVA